MRIIITALLLIVFGFDSMSQASKVRLPREDGKIVFKENFSHQKKQRELYMQLLSKLKSDPSIEITKADAEKLHIEAKGKWTLPVWRSRDIVTYKIVMNVKRNELEVRLEEFFNESVGSSVDKIIEINKDSDRELVQENLKFLRAGIHSRATEWLSSIKKFT